MRSPHYKSIIGIITHEGNAAKAQAIRDTWLPKSIPANHLVLFVYGNDGGSVPRIEGDKLILAVKDTWSNLPRKMHEFLTYCCAHFDFDGIYKIDDDEYVPFDRLIRSPRQQVDYAGVMFECAKFGKEKVYEQFQNYLSQRHALSKGYPLSIPSFYMYGGFSYYLSSCFVKEIISHPADEYEDCNDPAGCEDIMMGKAFDSYCKNYVEKKTNVENWGKGVWQRFWLYPICEIDLTADQIYRCHRTRHYWRWKHLWEDSYSEFRHFLSVLKQKVKVFLK